MTTTQIYQTKKQLCKKQTINTSKKPKMTTTKKTQGVKQHKIYQKK